MAKAEKTEGDTKPKGGETPTRRPLTDEEFAEAMREVGREAFGIRYDAEGRALKKD